MNESKCPTPCPLCGSAVAVYSADGADDYVAHCSGCYDSNPEAKHWARLWGGPAATEELAAEEWLEQAREYAARRRPTEIPPLPCQYAPVDLFAELARQVSEEAGRQRAAGGVVVSPAAVAVRRWKDPAHGRRDSVDARGAVGDGL